MGSAQGARAVVDWNSKERGYQIGTEHGTEGCYLSCLACKRTVRMRWDDIVKTWGVGVWTRDIARSLKCSQCGERQGSLMVWVDSRPRGSRDLPDTDSRPIIGALQVQRRLC